MNDNNGKKAGFTGIIGRPNVGKSTLMNYIIGQKIAITSDKPQTTRNRIRTVYTEDRGQIVFTDTPGIHKAKNKLGDYMVSVAKKAIVDVDAVMWIVEPTTYIGAGEQSISEEISKAKGIAKILVINKIDTLKNKAQILEVIEAYRKTCEFDDIIPVSAKTGEGVKELIDTLFDHMPTGEPYYEEDVITDQPLRQIVAELIREKALWSLKDEIPHGVAVVIESFEEGPKLCKITATIVCEKDSHKAIIIGKNGSMLKKIGSLARPDIEDMLECKVYLELWVKVRKDWRESDLLMKNFGYDKKELSYE
ncbi:MAG: GTPase Era [Lachnospiraceae bacterium]|nr:GTPase Era [Lachnospiraceae bacterium]